MTSYGPQAWEPPPRYRICPRGPPSPEGHSLNSHNPGHASRRAVHLVLRAAADSAHSVVPPPSRPQDTTPPLQADFGGSEPPDALATGWGRGRRSNSSTQAWKSLGSRPGRESDAQRKLDGAVGPACLQNGERRFLSQIERPRGLFLPGEKSILSPG